MNKPIKVYVAGPYSDDNVLGVLKNIGRGQYYASLLFRLGFAPFTPWHDKEFVIQNWDGDFTVKQFYNYSTAWLEVSDAVFVVPNRAGLKNVEDSYGTLQELKVARQRNIPIFFTVEELVMFYFSNPVEQEQKLLLLQSLLKNHNHD